MNFLTPETIAMIVLLVLGIIGFFAKLRFLRYITLIASVGVIGFYYSACLADPDKVQNLTLNIKDFVNSIDFYIKMGIIILPVFLIGSVFCGWVCPMGAFQEVFNLGGRKNMQFKVPENLDRYLRYIRFIALFALLIVPVLWLGKLIPYMNPFTVIFGFFDIPYFPIPLMIFAGFIVIGGIFLHRPWCRYFCPFGALLSLISKISLFKIKLKDKEACVKCGICEKTCQIGAIKMEAGKPKILQERCIRCGECIFPCPKDGLDISCKGE